jgi:hypothetical protein
MVLKPSDTGTFCFQHSQAFPWRQPCPKGKSSPPGAAACFPVAFAPREGNTVGLHSCSSEVLLIHMCFSTAEMHRPKTFKHACASCVTAATCALQPAFVHVDIRMCIHTHTKIQTNTYMNSRIHKYNENIHTYKCNNILYDIDKNA